MRRLLLLLMIIPIIGFGQCNSGDCENGYGDWTNPEAPEWYTGEWKDGLFNGIGKHAWGWEDEEEDIWGTYTNKGEFRDGQRHGYCITEEHIATDISWTYIGEYKDDKRNGIGVLKFADGSGFVAYWLDGKVIKEISKF